MPSKRSGTKAKSVGSATHGKPKVKRELKDLKVGKAKNVRGGADKLGNFAIQDLMSSYNQK